MKQDIADLISTHPLLAGLSVDLIGEVAGCAVNRVWHAGELLITEGEAADTLYLVRRGVVAIEVNAPASGPIVIETVGPGGVVGWSWMFPPYRWHFDARAAGAVGAIAIDAACLRDKADADPELGHRLTLRVAGVLLERLQMTRVRLLDLYGSSRAR